MDKTEAKNFSIEQLQEVLTRGNAKLGVYLYPTKRWMDWVDNSSGDARVMAVDAEGKHLQVSFSGGLLDQESIDYDSRMRFYLKKLK